ATTEAVSNEIISGERTFVKTDGSHKDGTTTLTYGGHATVKIVAADGTVIYVDPNYRDADYSDAADIVLVTHGHDDHTPCSNLQVKDDTTTITWKEAHPDPDVYETFEIGNIQIEAVPASNSNHSIKSCVGYIIFVDGIKIYHAGDTSMLDTMGDLAGKEIDFALYPIDGSYNMDAEEATEVANLVNAKYNIPIHEFDVGNVRKSDNFLPKSRLVLEYGDTIVISE
ncbi:MAG: MBL fold metallo-hydrolase, partial [Eubacteriales bacterium]|nr:MBL fold metallo-hydrolase [Eubacteriales bacterium]